MISAILAFVGKEILIAILFASVAIIYVVLSIYNYKHETDKKVIDIDTIKENIDDELKKFIIEGKEFEAIKIYRTVTAVGLKEAKEYVDLLTKSLIEEGTYTFKI